MATYYTNWALSNSSSPNSETYIVNGKKETYYNDIRYKFVIYESVNKASNTSTITVKKYACFYYTWGQQTSNPTATLGSSVNGGSYYTDSGSVHVVYLPTIYELMGTDTYTVNHNTDGSGLFTLNCYGQHTGGSGTTYTRYIGTKTISLTKIDRTSTISSNATSSAGKEFGESVTFSISRKSSAFTHKLTYKSGGTTYTIGEDIGTSKSYTFPTSLISNYPSSVKNAITVTCTTYNGTKKIGSDTCTAYISVPTSYVPTVSLALTEANTEVAALSLGANKFLQRRSKIAGTITASGSSGSTIKSYLTTGNNQTFKTATFTTGELSKTDNETFKSSVADSRGRKTETTNTIDIINYEVPTINSCKVERCDSLGNLLDEGTYGKATINYSISPINNGTNDLNSKVARVYLSQENPIEVTLSSYEGTHTFTTLFEDLDTISSYQFTFELEDAFEPSKQEYLMSPSFVTESKLAGGKGIAYGQTATEEGMHYYMPGEYHKGLKTNSMDVCGLKTEYINGVIVRYYEEGE